MVVNFLPCLVVCIFFVFSFGYELDSPLAQLVRAPH